MDPVQQQMPSQQQVVPQAVAAQTTTVAYAGFWRRFLAFVFDAILLFIVGFILGIITTSLLGIRATSIISQVIGIVLDWIYFAFFESSSYQATPGKMIMKIVVTDMEGNRLSFLHASLRFFTKIIFGVVGFFALFVGAVLVFAMAGWTKKKQTLYDIVVKTLVIKK